MMITRVYFVTYMKANPDGRTNTIGAMIVTTKGWLPEHGNAFKYAVDFIKENHGAVITDFRRI